MAGGGYLAVGEEGRSLVVEGDKPSLSDALQREETGGGDGGDAGPRLEVVRRDALTVIR